jgi:hypothetical protein
MKLGNFREVCCGVRKEGGSDTVETDTEGRDQVAELEVDDDGEGDCADQAANIVDIQQDENYGQTAKPRSDTLETTGKRTYAPNTCLD